MSQRYSRIVGTGGIGKGILFLSDDNSTLGRNESRLVRMSGAKDYCKLHIVFHYVAALLRDRATVLPIGYVGKDAYGDQLLEEMRAVGMDTVCVEATEHYPTTLSICLQYQDKEGCNFTASNGAGILVTPERIQAVATGLDIGPDTIVAAIPEVDFASRLELIQHGHERGAFCALSITVGEAELLAESGILQLCGLLAVNQEEAAAIVGGRDNDKVSAQHLHSYCQSFNPKLATLMTCGKDGAYLSCGANTEFIPAVPVKVVNTTGAGDAFLGGTIAAIAMGYPLQKGRDDETFAASPLASAPELGALCSGIAIECEDSIAAHISADLIIKRITQEGWKRKPCFIN